MGTKAQIDRVQERDAFNAAFEFSNAPLQFGHRFAGAVVLRQQVVQLTLQIFQFALGPASPERCAARAPRMERTTARLLGVPSWL